ncbi:MAG TPA: hypothetical protein VMS98_10775 [Thermoanaerobaculia bacterium]|nr:hypothetical protein [Thermoanaerobaculia bacterium]
MSLHVRWAYLKRVAAGAIFGLYMAHLLYFLNPQVDITPMRLLTVTLVYGVICGLLFGSALWLLRKLRVRIFGLPALESYRAHGFGFVVLAAFIASAIYWMNLTVFRIYLPIGAVRNLSKATTLITFVSFLLLLLWVIERTADRRTSRTIFVIGVVLIALSSFFLYQRRESYRTERRNVVVADVGNVAGRRNVTLVAIRNLPYDWIVTMSGEGLLPFLEGTAATSYFTRLTPFETTSWKALWATLATGKLPSRHGVTGRFSYRTPLSGSDPEERYLLLPSGVGFRAWGLIPPVKRISAQLPAGDSLPLWTLFERVGLNATAISWPDSTKPLPAPPNDSVMTAVTQRFSGTVKGAEIVAAFALDRAAMQAATASSGLDLRVVALEGFSETQRALHIYTNELPSRTSAKGDALRAYAQAIDRMLAEVSRAHPGDLLVICSPSAVVPPELPGNAYAVLARELRKDPGSDDGFALLRGEGVVHRPNPAPGYVADIVPTILFAAGLPVGRDMDGRILSEAFADEFLRGTTLSAIQTYEAEQVVVKRRGV